MKTPQKHNTLKESFIFLKRWISNPYRLGSIVPSSRALASFIAKSALDHLDANSCVLELGAGTGRFTQALLDAGLSPDRLICLELDRELAGYLVQRFPNTTIIQGNACFLKTLIPQAFHNKIGVVISGLPMMNFPVSVQNKIVDGCLEMLTPSGSILQFTYSPFSSLKCGYPMEKKRLKCLWKNFPPANVWRYIPVRENTLGVLPQ